jgi:hypothetical protein
VVNQTNVGLFLLSRAVRFGGFNNPSIYTAFLYAMIKRTAGALFLLLLFVLPSLAQKLNRAVFFTNEAPVSTTIRVDIKRLVSEKKEPRFVPCEVKMIIPELGSDSIVEPAKVRPRGNNRKENCWLASLMFDFKDSTSDLSELKKLKFVGGCTKGSDPEQLLMKEYLIYKMYNLFTEKSFRVRLLKVRYEDTRGKEKPFEQYGFFIEDVDDMAKRNDCLEKDAGVYSSEQANRANSTLVYLFQYMIGNTDWSVPARHNVKLIATKTDTLGAPFIIPYDFDYSGLVNAAYAVPDESLGTTKVTERVYRGFPRRIEELQDVAKVFIEKEKAVRTIIDNDPVLNGFYKKEMSQFLNEFFQLIRSEREIKNLFIDGARTR